MNIFGIMYILLTIMKINIKIYKKIIILLLTI